MVWHVQAAMEEREHALSEHILREVESSYGIPADRHALYRDMARGVATYCADDLVHGMPASYVPMLVSRALWGVGETDAAECVMNGHVEQRAVKQTLKALLSVSDVSPVLWKAVVAGAVRWNKEWITAEQAPVWRLDLTRIRRTACDMELASLLMVRTLVRALAPAWDATAGAGTLTVRVDGSERADRTMPAYIRSVLQREATARKWTATPRVLLAM